MAKEKTIIVCGDIGTGKSSIIKLIKNSSELDKNLLPLGYE